MPRRDISHTDLWLQNLVGTADEHLLYTYDSDIVTSDTRYDNPVLRIIVKHIAPNYLVSYQYLTSPRAATTSWAHWVDTTIYVGANCKPGVYDNRIFYMKPDGLCAFRDFDYNTLTFGTEHAIKDAGDGTNIIGFAPTSKTYVIIREIIPGASQDSLVDRSTMELWNNLDATPTQFICPTVSYGVLVPNKLRGFDAVRISGSYDYIFFAGDHGTRAEYVIRDSVHWSAINQVINLDITDEEAAFAPQYASLINGLVFMTMKVTRDQGGSFDGYTIGPAPFTMGRDIYITNQGSHDGKLFVFEDVTAGHPEIYYLGPNTCYVADSVNYTGANDQAANYLGYGQDR